MSDLKMTVEEKAAGFIIGRLPHFSQDTVTGGDYENQSLQRMDIFRRITDSQVVIREKGRATYAMLEWDSKNRQYKSTSVGNTLQSLLKSIHP